MKKILLLLFINFFSVTIFVSEGDYGTELMHQYGREGGLLHEDGAAVPEPTDAQKQQAQSWLGKFASNAKHYGSKALEFAVNPAGKSDYSSIQRQKEHPSELVAAHEERQGTEMKAQVGLTAENLAIHDKKLASVKSAKSSDGSQSESSSKSSFPSNEDDWIDSTSSHPLDDKFHDKEGETQSVSLKDDDISSADSEDFHTVISHESDVGRVEDLDENDSPDIIIAEELNKFEKTEQFQNLDNENQGRFRKIFKATADIALPVVEIAVKSGENLLRIGLSVSEVGIQVAADPGAAAIEVGRHLRAIAQNPHAAARAVGEATGNVVAGSIKRVNEFRKGGEPSTAPLMRVIRSFNEGFKKPVGEATGEVLSDVKKEVKDGLQSSVEETFNEMKKDNQFLQNLPSDAVAQVFAGQFEEMSSVVQEIIEENALAKAKQVAKNAAMAAPRALLNVAERAPATTKLMAEGAAHDISEGAQTIAANPADAVKRAVHGELTSQEKLFGVSVAIVVGGTIAILLKYKKKK